MFPPIWRQAAAAGICGCFWQRRLPRGVTIQTAGGQKGLAAVLENGWDEEELAVKLGRVLDLNGRRNGLERQLVGILAAAIQAALAG